MPQTYLLQAAVPTGLPEAVEAADGSVTVGGVSTEVGGGGKGRRKGREGPCQGLLIIASALQTAVADSKPPSQICPKFAAPNPSQN